MIENFWTVWACEEPPDDVEYRVVRDEWTENFRVRTIYEIKVVE